MILIDGILTEKADVRTQPEVTNTIPKEKRTTLLSIDYKEKTAIMVQK